MIRQNFVIPGALLITLWASLAWANATSSPIQGTLQKNDAGFQSFSIRPGSEKDPGELQLVSPAEICRFKLESLVNSEKSRVPLIRFSGTRIQCRAGLSEKIYGYLDPRQAKERGTIRLYQGAKPSRENSLDLTVTGLTRKN